MCCIAIVCPPCPWSSFLQFLSLFFPLNPRKASGIFFFLICFSENFFFSVEILSFFFHELKILLQIYFFLTQTCNFLACLCQEKATLFETRQEKGVIYSLFRVSCTLPLNGPLYGWRERIPNSMPSINFYLLGTYKNSENFWHVFI